MNVESASSTDTPKAEHTKTATAGKAKQWLWNFFSSGLPADYDLEVLRKIFLLNLMCLLGSFFLILLGIIEFILKDPLLGIVNFSFLLLLLGLFFYLRKTRNVDFVSLVGTIITGFFYFFFIAYGGVGNTAYVWSFTYPLIAIFLLGARRGTVFSLGLLALAGMVFVLGEKVDFFVTYNPYLEIRYIPAYLTIYLLAFVMEKTSEVFRRRLEIAKYEIEKTVGELEKANKSLGESEEKYRTFFNTSRDCVYITSIDGRVLDINNAALDFFGYDSMEELRKGKISDFYDKPEDREKYIEILKKQGFAKDHPIDLRKKDGTVIHSLVSTVPKMDENGNIIAFQGTFRDITDRIRMEERLRQAQKMEALGTLAGGVAHDLNNVLSGIVGYPDLLLLQLPEDSPLRKPILSIQETGLKAAAIVRDLLTLARRGVATYEVLSLNRVVSEYLESPEYKKMKSFYPDINVETHLETGLLNILGSPVHLSKVLMNLISNSAEAISEAGQISISTKNRYVDHAIFGYEKIDEGDYVTLTVSDSGDGISPEDMERIFEPFYTKKKMGKSGTGLGMAVVWGTLKDHKGYINVQSTEGEGTTFTLFFPVTRQKAAKDQASLPAKDYMGKGESVLVVDDLEEQRDLVAAMLSKLGYCVTTVPSGEKAVAYLRKKPTDILVLDMVMAPGMDGLETYRQILQIYPKQKAVIASGYSETDRVKEAQRLGAGQYIRKPYTLEKIGTAVKIELENE